MLESGQFVASMKYFFPMLLCLLALVGCAPTSQEQPSDNLDSTAAQSPQGFSQTGGISATGDSESYPEPQEDLQSLLQQLFAAKNPDYNGNAQFQMREGVPFAISLAGTGIKDISMLEGIPLMALDLSDNPISDLSALKGMPLRELFLEKTRVTDLSPIAGAPLMQIFLNETRISSIKALKGMPLKNIYLPDTRVRDLSPLAGMSSLQGLWLNNSPVENIEPLRGLPLVTLTLRGTNVKDLSPLAAVPTLQRLHLVETRVTDLTPVTQLRLTRLLFTPSRIKQGMDLVRLMPSLREIGDSLEGKLPPAQFWVQYDSSLK